MNWVQVHLALNHLPVFGAFFALATLVVAEARKSADLRRFAHWMFIFTALATIPVFFTGEPVEDLVERIPGVAKRMIESHEEAATLAFVIIGLAGAASAVSLLGARLRWAWVSRVDRLLIILAVVGCAAMARTAHLGGLIRHSELKSAVPAR